MLYETSSDMFGMTNRQGQLTENELPVHIFANFTSDILQGVERFYVLCPLWVELREVSISGN
jgi:hypothetical protein